MIRHSFLGYPVDEISLCDVLLWIRNGNRTGGTRVIAVLNINKLWLASHCPCMASYLHSAELIVPEYSIVWGAKKLGIPNLEPVYGIALTKQFIPFAIKHNLRPFFLGATSSTIEALRSKLANNYPQLEIAGMHHGFLSDRNIEAEVINSIQASDADILFVGMGSPLQEYWIDEHRNVLNVPVSIGVGGSFDVLAGIKPDSPEWIRGTGFEWVYRLILEPKRYWKRYLITNPWFIWQVLLERIITEPKLWGRNSD